MTDPMSIRRLGQYSFKREGSPERAKNVLFKSEPCIVYIHLSIIMIYRKNNNVHVQWLSLKVPL